MQMPASSDNRKTLQSYDEHVPEFVQASPGAVDDSFKIWLDRALDLANPALPILEIGSGPGRDASYMESRGYLVDRTDASQGFVDYQQKHGHACRLLDALQQDFGTGYGMVFANAVLLHFTPEEAAKVMRKAYDCLEPGGVFALTLKHGDGAKWESSKLSAPRFFQFWRPEALRKALERAGFAVEYMEEAIGNHRPAHWIQAIGQK